MVKTYCFDLDSTLCTYTGDYREAIPLQARIDVVNMLFDGGHYIKIYTARGMTTGMDYQALTESQLRDWGIKHHELIMGKPFADIYVDDKATSDVDFFAGSAE